MSEPGSAESAKESIKEQATIRRTEGRKQINTRIGADAVIEVNALFPSDEIFSYYPSKAKSEGYGTIGAQEMLDYINLFGKNDGEAYHSLFALASTAQSPQELSNVFNAIKAIGEIKPFMGDTEARDMCREKFLTSVSLPPEVNDEAKRIANSIQEQFGRGEYTAALERFSPRSPTYDADKKYLAETYMLLCLSASVDKNLRSNLLEFTTRLDFTSPASDGAYSSIFDEDVSFWETVDGSWVDINKVRREDASVPPERVHDPLGASQKKIDELTQQNNTLQDSLKRTTVERDEANKWGTEAASERDAAKAEATRLKLEIQQLKDTMSGNPDVELDIRRLQEQLQQSEARNKSLEQTITDLQRNNKRFSEEANGGTDTAQLQQLRGENMRLQANYSRAQTEAVNARRERDQAVQEAKLLQRENEELRRGGTQRQETEWKPFEGKTDWEITGFSPSAEFTKAEVRRKRARELHKIHPDNISAISDTLQALGIDPATVMARSNEAAIRLNNAFDSLEKMAAD